MKPEHRSRRSVPTCPRSPNQARSEEHPLDSWYGFFEKRVTEPAKPVVPSLLEADFRKSGVETAPENVGLAQLLTVAGAE
jgi:hypothetical protein